ncbi:MAG: hypothetical protein ABI822_05235 [Bryobacteraceae bacterium]
MPTITDVSYVASVSGVPATAGAITGINNTGRVIGFSSTPEFTLPSKGFVATLAGDVDSDLTRRFGGFIPRGINRSDQITGSTGEVTSSVFTLHATPQISLPGVLARAINADGVITGFTTSFPPTPFLYAPGFGINLIPGPSNFRGGGVAINRARAIAGGGGLLGAQNHATVWSSDTGLRDIGILYSPNFSDARAINRFGQATGYVRSSAFLETPFLYDPALGTTVLLDTVGIADGVGNGINAAGQVVGNRFVPFSGRNQAFLYTPGTGFIDLNSLPSLPSNWVLNSADAINDFGQIAGVGTINGQVRAYRLDLPLCSLNVSPANLRAIVTPALLQISVQVGAGGCR